MLGSANFIILDEPTNHLDIDSREILETALNSYTGTLFYVSHDRYFINHTASRILDLTHKSLVNYIGNYDYYLEKKETLEKAYLGIDPKAVATREETHAKQDWKAQKEEQARVRKRANDLKRTEKEIEELEREDAAIDAEFEKPEVACDPVKCTELGNRKEKISSRLLELYSAWEKLSEE
jgi:ATP-binding cassette subfamily F protein 3